jgi:hypothetical protein
MRNFNTRGDEILNLLESENNGEYLYINCTVERYFGKEFSFRRKENNIPSQQLAVLICFPSKWNN